MHALNLALVALAAPAVPLCVLALPAALRRRPVPWARVVQAGAVTGILAADFLLTPVAYLLPRALPLLHPHPWTVGRVFASLLRPAGGADRWWLSATALLLHRPEPAWAAIQVLFAVVLGPLVPLALRRASGASRDPVAARAATHGSSRWRRSRELARTLRRIRCDLSEEGGGGRAGRT